MFPRNTRFDLMDVPTNLSLVLTIKSLKLSLPKSLGIHGIKLHAFAAMGSMLDMSLLPKIFILKISKITKMYLKFI